MADGEERVAHGRGWPAAGAGSTLELALIEIVESGLGRRIDVAVGEAVPGLRHGEEHGPRRLVLGAQGERQARLGKGSIAIVVGRVSVVLGQVPHSHICPFTYAQLGRVVPAAAVQRLIFVRLPRKRARGVTCMTLALAN